MKQLEGWREGSPRVDSVQSAILWAPGSVTQPPLGRGRAGRGCGASPTLTPARAAPLPPFLSQRCSQGRLESNQETEMT